MKASELIKLLEYAISKYGDDDVEVNTCDDKYSDEVCLVRRIGDDTTWFDIQPKNFTKIDGKDFIIERV